MYNLLLNQAAFQIVHIIGTAIEVIELIILAAYRLLSLLLSLAFFCQFFCTFFLFAVVSINRIDIFQLTDVLVLPALQNGIGVIKAWLMNGIHRAVAGFKDDLQSESIFF